MLVETGPEALLVALSKPAQAGLEPQGSAPWGPGRAWGGPALAAKTTIIKTMPAAPQTAPGAAPAALAPHPVPQSLSDLFFSFTWLALQGFGGVLAVVQRELVEKKRWLTREEFIEDWAVAQILPGPNVINLSMMIGSRYFGLPGALAALAGMLVFPLIVVLLMALAGLITATGLKLAGALNKNPMGVRTCSALALLTFVAIGLFRVPLAAVLLSIGVLACIVAYWALGKQVQGDKA